MFPPGHVKASSGENSDMLVVGLPYLPVWQLTQCWFLPE